MGPSRNCKNRNRFSLQSLQEGMQPWPQLDFSQERPTLGFSQTELCMCSVWLFAAPMDCSPPGCSVHGILQARVLEWGAMSSPRRSSQPRDQTWVSYIYLLLWQVDSLPLVPLGKLICSLTVHKMHESTTDLPHGASNLFCQLQSFKELAKLRVVLRLPWWLRW